MANLLMISGAMKLGTSKSGRKVLGGLLVFFALTLMLLICAISGLISIFTNSGKINSNFNAQDTAIYRELRSIYDVYAETVKTQIEELVVHYRDSNMDYELEEVYNPETKKYETVEKWYCKAEISWDFEYIPSAYTLAYLSVKNQKEYLSDRTNIRIDEDEVSAFWNAIGGIKTEESGTEEEPVYFIHNPVMTPEEIADHFFVSASLKKQYLESVYLISQFVGTETFEEDMQTAGNRLNIPLYYQYAEPWGSKKYGNGTIAKNGCAPTSIAMVLTGLKGYAISPADVVDFTQDRYYVSGAGSSWDIFPACAAHWEVSCTYIGTSKASVVSALESGCPVILSMGPGRFTSSGHMIVLTGITDSGKITVNDPNDNSRKNHANIEFSLSQVLSEAKGGWKFE